jgi:hypothetical protein
MGLALNQSLLARLKRRFGSVKIDSQGQSFVARPVRDYLTGEPRLRYRQTGEYYRTNCPFCSDTRHRLYINHMYGREDAWGRPMYFLATCFNETACMRERDNQYVLRQMIEESPGSLGTFHVRRGTIVTHATEKTMPGPCKLVSELDPYHEANEYLISRKFDPHVLGEFYGVSYCMDSIYYFAKWRIVVPTYQDGKLVGWQARYLGELPWYDKSKRRELPPKYFTCPGMDRGLTLGNIDMARKYTTGVLMEGWFDVFALGPMGMCYMGDNLTAEQLQVVSGAFKGRSLVLLPDPEEFDKPAVQRTLRTLRRRLGGDNVAAVKLPEGTDPGSLDRPYLRHYIESEASRQGVRVAWEKHRG